MTAARASALLVAPLAAGLLCVLAPQAGAAPVSLPYAPVISSAMLSPSGPSMSNPLVVDPIEQNPWQPPQVQRYDCHAELNVWEMAWTPDWKDWCCKHEKLGCPPTTTKTFTSTTLTSSTTTITSTITSTSTHTSTTATSTTVTSTSTLTTTQTNTSTVTSTSTTVTTTSSVTSTSSTTSFTVTETTLTDTSTTVTGTSTSTETTTISTTETITTSTTIDGCKQECLIMGESATCQSRITYAETHVTMKEEAPCPAAHVVVMSQCEVCGGCQFQNVECVSDKGVSKDAYDDEYMYKKYQALAVRLSHPESQERASLQSIGLKLTGWLGAIMIAFIVAGIVRTRRSGRHFGGRAERSMALVHNAMGRAESYAPVANVGDEEAVL